MAGELAQAARIGGSTMTPAILVGVGRSSVFPELPSHEADLVSAEAQDPGGGLIEAQASAGIKIACP